MVDIFQTGSGTSTNMNANEVIANRANEILGSKKGTYRPVHPNDHVNLGQSSNDVFPSAIHIASVFLLQQKLLPALRDLHKALKDKAEGSSIPFLKLEEPISRMPRQFDWARNSEGMHVRWNWEFKEFRMP